ncbi:MAG TPA: SRPBCC family protein [Candidatus Limnocylindrales bacterium]|nr:SRPBCC family protein [Candidatus Limnocylindrales bacterium]
MKSELRLTMHAPWERIFRLAAEVERWPEILPHYRYVRRLPDPDGERRFAMGARRGAIPVSWEAIQRPMQDSRTIEFVHTGGVTKGMWVAWRFEPFEGGTEVSIEHRLELGWPLIGGFAASRVIGPQFIEAIAGRTLRRIRQLAEAPDR